jgi:hypothetical protein
VLLPAAAAGGCRWELAAAVGRLSAARRLLLSTAARLPCKFSEVVILAAVVVAAVGLLVAAAAAAGGYRGDMVAAGGRLCTARRLLLSAAAGFPCKVSEVV